MWEGSKAQSSFSRQALAASEAEVETSKKQNTELDIRARRLQDLVEEAWYTLCEEHCPRVVSFGSQQYGLASESSDWDFCLQIKERLPMNGNEFRAVLRKLLCDKHLTSYNHSKDQNKNYTLKWKLKRRQGPEFTQCFV